MTLELRGDGLVLREWTDADVPAMVRLFDEPSIDEWTPLAAPFDVDAATRYVARARAMSEDGTGVQLAVTADGVTPLGEVLLFLREDSAELGYAVGLDHRGARLASRALGLLLDHAREAHGVRRFVLRISPGNVASMRVAEACGFRLTDAPLLQRELKGRPVELGTWEYRV